MVDEFDRSHGIRPKYVIPIGINTVLFNTAPTVKDIDIIGVGALNFLKQYILFVQTTAALRKDIPFIKAMLCGDGEAREEIETMIEKLSLGKNILLTGFVQHTEALKLMQRAKILLHPSSYEGFGTVCLEALYAGAHVISFVQPMYHEIKNWHIVKTVEEMQAKALELLQDANTKYENLPVYSSDEAAKKVLKLFGYA